MHRRNYLLSPLRAPHFADDGTGEGEGGQGGGTATVDKFEAITSQEALNALIADRVRRAESRGFKSAEEKYKPGHERAEALDHELSSEAEKQAREAREDERAKARSEYSPKLVRQAFRAEAKGVLDADQTKELMEFIGDLDLTKYLDAAGEVDEDKIAKRITKLFPATTRNGAGGGTPPRPLGQGHQSQAPQSARDLGRAEAEKRFGKRH